jgi:hypothetical protein
MREQGYMGLGVVGGTESEEVRVFGLGVVAGGFVWSPGPNMVRQAGVTGEGYACIKNGYGVLAVGAAEVTVGVVLAPGSLYGGGNPATGAVVCCVHSVYY